MAQPSKGLTHDEIWDDSALIESWNEALAEYKKYHSLLAKGGTLEDLKKLQETKTKDTPSKDPTLMETDEGEIEEYSKQETQEEKPQTITPNVVAPGPSPQALLGTVKDENLKRLLMSWYYAGYYTGLHEGHQQAQAET